MKKRRSLQILMVGFIAAIVTLVLSGLGAMDYIRERSELTSSLDKDMQIISGRLAVNLVAPLWDMNAEGAKGVLESEMTNRNLYAAMIMHKDKLITGVVRDEAWDVVSLESPVEPGDYETITIPLVYEKNGKETDLGELSLFMSKKFLNETLRETLLATILRVIVVDAILILGIVFFVRRTITRSLQGMIAMLKDIAEGEGDLTRRLEDKSGTEIQELADWFNIFIDKIRAIITEVVDNAQRLETSAQNLLQLSSTLSTSAEAMAGQSNSASTSLNSMSANMNSVASAMEQFAVNIGTVAASSEEMSSTIHEISQNTAKAKDITGNAVLKSTEASDRVNELGSAAQEISKVTETITAISSQTNLLALNATIEAARAGEAGRGFAVVANEIKELAMQTARATEEIREKIHGIQSATGTTVGEIHHISQIVGDVDQIVATIAAAVEEQSVTTRDIADNVGQASQGVKEVNENVAHADTVTRQIARSVDDVSGTSGDISNMAGTVQENSEALSALAKSLNALVGKFRI